jgi:hypothetical protein
MDMFTQCAAVLFERAPSLEDVERGLDGWSIACPQEPTSGEDGWLACGRGFVVELQGGGSVIVDVVDRPWPDESRAAGEGDPLAAAYRSGLFGPTAARGALARAKAQAWAWDGGARAAERHRAFVRLRTVVALSAEERSLPRDHDPVHELTTLTEMSGTLLTLPGALALFLPGGEALRSREQVEAAMRRKIGAGPPPIDLWANLRALPLGQIGEDRWMIVDTVGMGQLRLPDEEALFAEGQEQVEAVARLLRNASLHLLGGKPVADGATADDGSGRRWTASRATGALAPERQVVRWLPRQSKLPDQAMLSRLGARQGPRGP